MFFRFLKTPRTISLEDCWLGINIQTKRDKLKSFSKFETLVSFSFAANLTTVFQVYQGLLGFFTLVLKS